MAWIPRLRRSADARVRIPMPGSAESLNIAAAAAICLYQSARASSREQSTQAWLQQKSPDTP